MDNKFIADVREAATKGIKKIQHDGGSTGVWSAKEIIAMHTTIIMLADELLKKSK